MYLPSCSSFSSAHCVIRKISSIALLNYPGLGLTLPGARGLGVQWRNWVPSFKPGLCI